jgi:acetyl-CoA carboxylase beta subunit
MMHGLGARQLLELVLDEDSFTSWDEPIDTTSYAADYAAVIERAQVRARTDESITTGTGMIRGLSVAVIVGEFQFLGGSIGKASADRLIQAIQRATRERLPLLAAPASGGTRMQEGTPAFVQMVAITRAVMAHKKAQLPYLVYLRHPTTGGVFASWGSLGHVTVAEPGALIGFLGPRVYKALYHREFPAGVQVSENLADKGIIDGVVEIGELAGVTDRVLRLLGQPIMERQPLLPERPFPDRDHTRSAWDSVLRTRRPDRPGIREVLRNVPGDTVPLSGTADGERDHGLLLALTRLDGISCVLIAQDRRHQSLDSPMGPAALREARRGMRLAEELGIPLVSVIDTPGAALSKEAEEGGMAGEIARCLVDMSSLTVPSVSVLLGQGSGGGALALFPAQRVIAAEHAWLSPLPPEGASVIMHGDVEHAAEMAGRQQVDSSELLAAGIVHQVVPEQPDAADEPEAFSRRLVAAIGDQLRQQS